MRFENFRQEAGDRVIAEALSRHARAEKTDVLEYIEECLHIAAAMPQAQSIDNYLDAHQGNRKLELCGKLAIAQAILEAENKSKLKIDNANLDKFERFSPQHVQDTWYERFFMLLTESVRRGGLTKLFDNVSFVIFNYDRCVEHFLYYSLQNYYRLTEQEAAQLLERLTITHPYGAVGRLPWQIDKAGVPFGVHQNDMRLLEIAGQIKTFTE